MRFFFYKINTALVMRAQRFETTAAGSSLNAARHVPNA